MSIETQVAELVANTTKLTERIEGQADEWDEKIQKKEDEVDEYLLGAVASQTGMKNYYLDPFGLDITKVNGKKIPNTGFRRAFGKMTIECVSPFEKGAMAVGTNNKPQTDYPTSTTDHTIASEASPYYSPYGSGKVFYKGGLGSLWGGNKSNGNIFKIISPPTAEVEHCWLGIEDVATLSQFVQVKSCKIRLRTWIFIEKGVIMFGSHSGYLGIGKGVKFSASTEWQFVDITFSYSTGNPLFRGINIGSNYTEDVEMYMAAPLITVETGSNGYMA